MLVEKDIELVSLIGDVTPSKDGSLAHSHWLGVSQEQDAHSSKQALSDQLWDWIIVDHYALDARWERSLRASAKQIMVIDDITDRQHDCDVLLDQNFYADMQTRYVNKVPAHCQLLLGPRYALLREEFSVMRDQVEPRSGVVRNILVFFGGVDAGNHTGPTLEALAEMARKELKVDVVIGAQHPCREQILEACVIHSYVCHVQTKNMAELMAKADLAIGAGGSATWERCCLGLPTLSICIASNQRRQIEDAAAEGLLYAPSDGGDLKGVIKRHISALLENALLLKHISTSAMAFVDGRGTTRVTSILNVSNIEVKKASASDSLKLFEWRNHPMIRSVSRNTDLITWESHQLWLINVLADKDRVLLIGYFENEPVGVVRFNTDGDAAEVSIYLVPESGFTGQGRNLLFSAEQWLKGNRTDIKRVRANVLGGNVSSRRLFLGAKYRLESTSYLKEL